MSWLALIGALAVLLRSIWSSCAAGEITLRGAAIASALWVGVALAFFGVLLAARR